MQSTINNNLAQTDEHVAKRRLETKGVYGSKQGVMTGRGGRERS